MTAPHDPEFKVPPELAHLVLKAETPDLGGFAGRLEYIRQLVGLTRTEMAAKIDVPAATYRIWASGSIPTKPDPFEVCLRVEKAFGVPRVWLAWGSDT